MPLGMELGLSLDDFVLDGNPALPLPQKGRSPQFSAHIYCDQTAAYIKMPLATEVGLGPNDIVLHGDPASPPQKKSAQPPPNFQPMYCGQAAGCIKMPLATEVGLGQGHIVLDGDPAPPKQGHSSPHFRLVSIVAKRLDPSRCHPVWR